MLLINSTFFYFTSLFLGVLGLDCCARVFSSCGKQGLLFVEVHGLLLAAASLVEHGLQAKALNSYGTQAQMPCSKDGTCVLRIGRQILIHCTTREVPLLSFFFFFKIFLYRPFFFEVFIEFVTLLILFFFFNVLGFFWPRGM